MLSILKEKKGKREDDSVATTMTDHSIRILRQNQLQQTNLKFPMLRLDRPGFFFFQGQS